MPRFTPEMAEAVARSLENDVKLVQFFERYDKENKGIQDDVETELETILDNFNDPSVTTIDYGLTLKVMYKALRATKRARHFNLRLRMKMLINLVKRFQLMDQEVVTKEAVKKLVQMFINIYTFLIDDHIRYTSQLEDSLIFAMPQGMSETAMAYNDSIRNVTDTEAAKKRILEEAGDQSIGENEEENMENIDTKGLF